MDKVTQLFRIHEPKCEVVGNPDYFIAGIRKNILQSKLSQLHIFVKRLSLNSSMVSQVIPPLNGIFRPVQISFTWFAASEHEQGSLLIRNMEIGLVLPTTTDATPRAMMMIPELNADDGNLAYPGFHEALAKNVLIKLAKQAQPIQNRVINTVD